ncbi:unnamed protein product [Ceutorhynchus assimilis]|uniref:non-specific serine/threonine protein kinase n=1 Tax=Ceutorhynchus assimilis TaxID=467358 RepID=A0A9N9MJ51_9CUCU|nr:unnamed protein product [Ceutorhynchus assimilis]
MPRKASPAPNEPPRKKKCSSSPTSIQGQLKKGEIILDNRGEKWKLGQAIGIGGFGEIYDVVGCDQKVKDNEKYVAKIEKHSNGPLFVEINCYLRMGRLEMIEQWKKDKDLEFLGLPHFVASGSHMLNSEKYRFLIIPKYHRDLEAILKEKQIFNLKTVLVIASRIMDTLEYIHNRGYIHSDIKASNIMLAQDKPAQRKSSRSKTVTQRFPSRTQTKPKLPKPNLRPSAANINYFDDIPGLEEALKEHENGPLKSDVRKPQGDLLYLLDYGLASKYLLSTGEYRDFNCDQRKAHAGTILFCSRDAHKGISSQRSDLESLAYNMIYWLTGTLPWVEDVQEPELVAKKKNRCFTDVKKFLQICFEDFSCPRFMVEMFEYLNQLQLKDTPNYAFFHQLFKKTIKEYGYVDNGKLDFENLEGWGQKQKEPLKGSRKENNRTVYRIPSLLLYSPLRQLSANILFKRPKLRNKIKDKLAMDSMMNWSKILVQDPETIMKQAATRKTSEDDKTFNILEFDLESLNPTPAMREVFNCAAERVDRSPAFVGGDELCSIDNIEGYTSEMMRVHRIMMEQKELELDMAIQENTSNKRRTRKKKINQSPRASSRNCRSNAPTQHGLRKAKVAPFKRTYRLRG